MMAKGAILLAAVLVATMTAAVAAPATADTSGGFPDYVLLKDGTVLIDGDGATDCRSFALFLEDGYFESGDISAGAQRVLEQCVEAGLLDPELAVAAGASPEVAAANGNDGGLPGTGGPELPALLLAAAGLAFAGLLFRWARS